MKPLIDFFNQNIDNKLLFSKEDIFKKKGMFSLSPFGDVYLKGISELLGQKQYSLWFRKKYRVNTFL